MVQILSSGCSYYKMCLFWTVKDFVLNFMQTCTAWFFKLQDFCSLFILITFQSVLFFFFFFFQFSPFVAQIKNAAVTQGFFFWRCLPRMSLAVSVTAVLKVVIIESMSLSSLFMMVRGANFPPIITWKVSNTLGSFSFSRSNLSLVFWLADSFQTKVEGHHR